VSLFIETPLSQVYLQDRGQCSRGNIDEMRQKCVTRGSMYKPAVVTHGDLVLSTHTEISGHGEHGTPL